MTEKRKEALLYRALGYISQIECGQGLYESLHDCVGMTNAEIAEVGYELEEYHQPDTPTQMASASDKRYIALEELERQAREIVEFIVRDGTQNTSNGNWISDFDELQKQTKLCMDGKPFFQQLIGNMLCERPEVADLSIGEGCFDVDYYLDYCPNCEQEQDAANMVKAAGQTLGSLIQMPLEDVHLVHCDEEIELATIVELNAGTLTDAGKEAWADVLDAKVCRIFQGIYGLQVELDCVSPTRLSGFSQMLAGYCSEEHYQKWVTQEDSALAQAPK